MNMNIQLLCISYIYITVCIYHYSFKNGVNNIHVYIYISYVTYVGNTAYCV